MELKMKNALEVVELITALEARIYELQTVFAFNEHAINAIMNVYNQVKEQYGSYFSFKY